MKKLRTACVAAAVCVLVACTGSLVYHAFISRLPELWPIVKNGDSLQLEHYLEKEDIISGLVCVACLEFLQVFSIVLPGAPIAIAGGIVYGTLRSFVVCHLSFVAANVIVFYIAKKANKRLDKYLPKSGKMAQVMAQLKNTVSPEFMTMYAFLIPGVPNGIIPYGSAKTHISTKQFACLAYIGTFPTTLFACAIGRCLLIKNYIMCTFLVGAMAILLIGVYCSREKLIVFWKRCSAGLYK